MTGIFLVIVVAIWIVFIKWLTPKLVSSIKHARLKQVVSVLIFVILLILPVIDEIIGGMQFRSLCKEGAVLKVDEEKARGKVVIPKLSDGDYVSGTAVAISEQSWNYMDSENGELLLSYKTLHAHGGFFIRALGISENNSPLTFENSCGPKEMKTIFKRLNITVKYK